MYGEITERCTHNSKFFWFPNPASEAPRFMDALLGLLKRKEEESLESRLRVPLAGFLSRVVLLLTGLYIGPPHRILFVEKALLLKKKKKLKAIV